MTTNNLKRNRHSILSARLKLKEYAARIIGEHWKTLAGWGLSGWIALATSWANELLPLPKELFLKGVIWWGLFSTVVVLITATHSLSFLRRSADERYIELLVPMICFLFCFTI